MTDYLKSIINAFQDMIFIFDSEGIIVDYLSPNHDKELITPREAFLGRHYKNVMPPDVVNKTKSAFEKVQRGAVSAKFDYKLEDSGEISWYTAVISKIEEEGEDLRYLVVVRNITKRVNSEKACEQNNLELKKLNRQKDKLFSVIAHDLRNAVAGSTSLFDLILEDFDHLSKEEMRSYLLALHKNSVDAKTLLEDLLLWSKNQFEQTPIEPRRVDLSEAVRDVLAMVMLSAKEKQITLENRIADGMIIHTDPEMLKTILRNLVINAIKFSHEKGRVTLRAQNQDGIMRISITDEGVGMTSEMIKKVLTKNIQYTTQGTAGEKGSGLGLDLSIDFVEKHGGSLDISSEPGRGSTFTISLPITQDRSAEAEPAG